MMRLSAYGTKRMSPNAPDREHAPCAIAGKAPASRREEPQIAAASSVTIADWGTEAVWGKAIQRTDRHGSVNDPYRGTCRGVRNRPTPPSAAS
jgi:hypothetical protein